MDEDMVLMMTMRTSPGRLAFYVDVGDMPPPLAREKLEEFKQSYEARRNAAPTPW